MDAPQASGRRPRKGSPAALAASPFQGAEGLDSKSACAGLDGAEELLLLAAARRREAPERVVLSQLIRLSHDTTNDSIWRLAVAVEQVWSAPWMGCSDRRGCSSAPSHRASL